MVRHFLPPPPAKKGAQQKKAPAAQNVGGQKLRVALPATSLAVAVAQNGHLAHNNVATAQKRNS